MDKWELIDMLIDLDSEDVELCVITEDERFNCKKIVGVKDTTIYFYGEKSGGRNGHRKYK